MYKINDYIMYKREVCKVKLIKEKHYKDKDYYILEPVSDSTLTIDVPIDSKFLKDMLTKNEIDELIKKMPDIPIIECDTRLIENEYKSLLASEDYEDLIKIIKTTYLRNKERMDNKKRIGDKDSYYFNKAESYLYQEMAIVLNIGVEEVKEYIKRILEKRSLNDC